MPLETNSLHLIRQAVEIMQGGFSHLPANEQPIDMARLEAVLEQVSHKMQDNYPYFHPLYAGQMLKPPHPVARLAYMLALWINPNNHALDGGRASSQMEKEAVAEIGRLFGWKDCLGHLTSGGTMANLEALWVAGQLKPGAPILASQQAHYTHGRISDVLGLPFESVDCDRYGRMDIAALENRLEDGPVAAVVATLGTTATGAVDPLSDILALKKKSGFRLHADAAYGGYFALADNLASNARAAFDQLHQVDSIVVDPHKHGLQPYGCGCILHKDPAVGRFYQHDSPYTYFTSDELHLGEISLECSRAGASAVALWATQQMLPYEKGGQFAADLSRCRSAALDLHRRVAADPRFKVIMPPELDILVWAPSESSATKISAESGRIFTTVAEKELHLATVQFPAAMLAPLWPDVDLDQSQVTCLRSCLMKPEHSDWVDRIWNILSAAV